MRTDINQSKLRRLLREHEARTERCRQLMAQYRSAIEASNAAANLVHLGMQSVSTDRRAFMAFYGRPMSELVALPVDVQQAAGVNMELATESIEERVRAGALMGHFQELQEQVRTDGELLGRLCAWAGHLHHPSTIRRA